MTDLIHRLLAWMGLLLIRRRTEHVPPSPAAPLEPSLHLLPPHRSPYGLHTPLDGTATIAVRPYLTAHEQRQRRRELALATLGLDMPGPYWIHGVEVA
ncbi:MULTISPECIES: hypothetical protein [unclassified Streptomyces]|uniref:hypothetical protein n=1 Tax=unclassified Streptomyces TaxID=2593676 RepID=UPI002259DEC7|nr:MULTISPECIES: hypothetical protein [unclassified Streptomyces]MCX4882326.1 hypothetical protein [Streptomyces sp. NBC_00847]MCX5049816.1 hypothetical protein [Streptomyces sp. NBC_00474]